MKKEIRIEIPAPNDCHAHLRVGKMMKKVIAFHNVFENVITMGNLVPPVFTSQLAKIYEAEIMVHKPTFRPHITLMLVRKTTPAIIWQAKREGIRFVKYIPEGASTNSEYGIPIWELEKHYDVLETIEREKMHFLGHWELAVDPKNRRVIPFKEREEMAIPYLAKVVKNFPKLKITVEHASTEKMINFITNAPDNIAATLTAHHAGPYYYEDVFGWDRKNLLIHPEIFCLPVLKGLDDVEAVTNAMISGNPKFMFGSDSAPHPPESKKLPDPKPGIFSAPTALSWICVHFSSRTDMNVKLLQAFLHDNSCQWYGFPRSDQKIVIERKKWKVPEKIKGLIPFMAGEKLYFKISA